MLDLSDAVRFNPGKRGVPGDDELPSSDAFRELEQPRRDPLAFYPSLAAAVRRARSTGAVLGPSSVF